MEIEKYYQIIDEFADDSLVADLSPQDFLMNLSISNPDLFDELINFRKEFVGKEELDRVEPYLSVGYFKLYSEFDRKVCYVICFELNEVFNKKRWRKRCEPYNDSQPLFYNAPNLISAVINDDLINYSVLNLVDCSEVLQLKGGYTYLDYALSPLIVEWAKESFPTSNIYLRAHPYKFFNEKPPRLLLEAATMPANPNWWRELKIYNRTKEGASYILEDCSPSDNSQQYWDLHVRGIKKLEVIAKRNNNGNLSMMIEEVANIDSDGIMVGRCIHLDSDAIFGTNFDNAVLNHLDLAVNIYEDADANRRLEDNLASGKVVDATYRTHLLRIENIPFRAMFGFLPFFKSQVLVNEWLADQFNELK